MPGSIELTVREITKTFCFRNNNERDYIIALVKFINNPSNKTEPDDIYKYLITPTNDAYIIDKKEFENIIGKTSDLRGNISITTSSGTYRYYDCIIENVQKEELRKLLSKKNDKINEENTISTNNKKRDEWKNKEFRTRSHVTVEPTPNNSIRNILSIGILTLVAATTLYLKYNNEVEKYSGGTDLSKQLENEIKNENPNIKIGTANEINNIETTDDLKTFIENGVKDLSPQEKEEYETIIAKRFSREQKKKNKNRFSIFSR